MHNNTAIYILIYSTVHIHINVVFFNTIFHSIDHSAKWYIKQDRFNLKKA